MDTRTPARTVSRRQFLKRSIGAAVLLGAPGLVVTSCSPNLGLTTEDVANIFEGFGELPKLINEYRVQEGLDEIPLSPSMTAVALKHVMDLAAYQPEKACGDNYHSWSSNGSWTGGCYDSNDSSTWPIMWDKPKELTKYPDKGYEIAYWHSSKATPQLALDWWKTSTEGHNDVILNKGQWSSYTWKALGGVALENYACAWFGTVEK